MGKRCKSCNIIKIDSAFSKLSRSKDGLNSVCRSCDKARKDAVTTEEPTVTSKACSLCKIVKSASSFDRNTRTVSGLQSACKGCRKHYRSSRATSEHRVRRLLARHEALQAYGAECVCCGESDYRFLTFDHVDNDGAEHRKSLKGLIYDWARKHNYPASLRILCYNCNCARQHNGGICPHQDKRTLAETIKDIQDWPEAKSDPRRIKK